MFEERSTWIAAMNCRLPLAVDGLSMDMVLLTAIISAVVVAGVLEAGEECEIVLVCSSSSRRACFGVFTALNFFHWFIFWDWADPDVFPDPHLGAEDRTYAS